LKQRVDALLVVLAVAAVFGGGARRDVVNLGRRIVFEIVHIVDAAARTLFDWTAGLVVLLSPLFVAKTTRRRWRPEVRTPIASTGSWRRAAHTARARSEAAAATAWPWAAKTTAPASEAATAWPWATEATRTRSEAPAWTWRTRPAIFARTRFADRQRASLEGLRVEFLDDVFSDSAIGELDERETARTTGLAIDRHGNVGWLGDGSEVSSKISLTCPVGEIPDEQTDCQSLLVKTA